MRLALAQTRPTPGDIAANLLDHMLFSERAAASGCDLVAFSELSLTGYEPALANHLATTGDDPRLVPLQRLSDRSSIVIALGVPSRGEDGVRIGMVLLRPAQAPLTYAKQLLHRDEEAWFVPGTRQVVVEAAGTRVAPAICYESLQGDHAASAHAAGADLYLASVAKHADGLAGARRHYPAVARRFEMVVAMVNAVGPCSEMRCAGASEIWGRDGRSLARARSDGPDLLIVDV